MKPSHRKDVILARLVFLIFCIAIVSIVYSVGSHLISNSKKNAAVSQQEQQGGTGTEDDDSWKLTDSQAAELPTTEVAETSQVVTTKSVNLRSEASTSASVISVLPSKTELTLLETGDDGWAKVDYNGVTGYVSGEYIKPAGEESADNEGTDTTYKVKTTAKVKLRSDASKNATVLTTIPKGTKLEASGEEDGWTKVTYKGKTGYVSTEYVKVQ